MENDKPISIGEAAKIKGVTRQAVDAAIKAGILTAIEVLEPVRRITPESLQDWQPNPKRQACGRKAKTYS